MLMCPVSHPEILVNISVLVNLSEKILVGIEPSRLIQLLAEFPYRHCSAVTALFDFNLRKTASQIENLSTRLSYQYAVSACLIPMVTFELVTSSGVTIIFLQATKTI